MNKVYLACAPLDGRSGHAVGRALLHRLYRDLTGEDCPEISRTVRGKPYFTESCYHFSISHTRAHAFCALSLLPVGIDAEETDRSIPLPLADKILSHTERKRFDDAGNPRDALLRLWVLKEASAKLTGEGLRGYPNRTDFSPDDMRIHTVAGCYLAVLTDAPCKLIDMTE